MWFLDDKFLDGDMVETSRQTADAVGWGLEVVLSRFVVVGTMVFLLVALFVVLIFGPGRAR